MLCGCGSSALAQAARRLAFALQQQHSARSAHNERLIHVSLIRHMRALILHVHVPFAGTVYLLLSAVFSPPPRRARARKRNPTKKKKKTGWHNRRSPFFPSAALCCPEAPGAYACRRRAPGFGHRKAAGGEVIAGARSMGGGELEILPYLYAIYSRSIVNFLWLASDNPHSVDLDARNQTHGPAENATQECRRPCR